MTCATMAMLIRWIVDHPPNKPPSAKPVLLQDALDNAQIATATSDYAEATAGRAAVSEDRLENDFPMVYVDLSP
jgi:hypothetical protein